MITVAETYNNCIDHLIDNKSTTVSLLKLVDNYIDEKNNSFKRDIVSAYKGLTKKMYGCEISIDRNHKHLTNILKKN